MRLDRALHGLRLFKSRSQAAAAVEAGGVLWNGKPVKPSHVVRAGDRITVLGPSGARTWEVLDLPRASLSKSDAARLLREVAGQDF